MMSPTDQNNEALVTSAMRTPMPPPSIHIPDLLEGQAEVLLAELSQLRVDPQPDPGGQHLPRTTTRAKRSTAPPAVVRACPVHGSHTLAGRAAGSKPAPQAGHRSNSEPTQNKLSEPSSEAARDWPQGHVLLMGSISSEMGSRKRSDSPNSRS